MNSNSRIFIGLVLVAAVALVPLLTWDSQHAPQRHRRSPNGDAKSRAKAVASGPTQAFSHEDFVGSQSCKSCHEDIFNRYISSSMGQSMSTPAQLGKQHDTPAEKVSVTASVSADDAPMRDDFVNTIIEPPGNRRYRVTVGDGTMTHSEFRVDRDGELIYEQEKPIAYILGSGKRGRSYLIHEGEMLFQSPLGWYAGGKGWGLSPGYAPKSHPRFSREVSDGCLYCHAGRTNSYAADDSRYHNPVFWETRIGCERCHGPGKEHIAFHTDGEDKNDASDPIVNPASLEPKLRDSVCNQCHLLGQSVVRKSGKSFFDFQPGQTLEEAFVMLARDDVHQAGMIGAVSQVEQMHASRCYQESEGALGCISCHDPHSSPKPEQQAAFYRERCLKCHQQQGCLVDEGTRLQAPANNSCIHCHMPKLPTEDVPHTSLTHHGVLRTPNDAAAKSDAPRREGLYVFGDGEQRLTRLEIDRAKGITLMMNAWNNESDELATTALMHLHDAMLVSPDRLDQRLAKLSDAQMLEELAAGYFLLEKTELAHICWERLLELYPENTSALTGLAKLAIEAKDIDRFESLLKRLGKLDPPTEDYLQMMMQYGFHAGEPATVIEAGEALLKRNPGLVTPRRILIDAYKQLGEDAKAEAHEAMIDRM